MDMTTELRVERARLIGRCREILDNAEDEQRDLTAEETQEYERCEADMETLGRRIDRLERQERREREHEAAGAGSGFDPRLAQETTVQSPDEIAAGYNTVFNRYVVAGVAGLDADEQRILQRGFRASDSNNQVKGTPNLGGYTVPTGFHRQLVTHLEEQGAMRLINTTKFPTESGETIQIPKTATYGEAAWITEASLVEGVGDTYGQASLGAHTNRRLVKVSIELLQDNAVNLEGHLSQRIGESIGRLENTAFAVGDGSNKPLGLLAASGGVDVGVTADSATAITADEVTDLCYSVPRVYRSRGQWVMNDATIAVVRKLKDAEGRYIWQQGLMAGEPDRLLGYPLFTDFAFPEIASAAKIATFGDHSAYWIRDTGGFLIRRLEERFIDYGQVGFLAFHRTDGKLIDTAGGAVKALQMAA